jgi:hypothetical protein
MGTKLQTSGPMKKFLKILFCAPLYVGIFILFCFTYGLLLPILWVLSKDVKCERISLK